MNTIDEILTSLRRMSGLSGRELARRAGTTHSALVDYAKGRHDPGFSTLERIALAGGYDLVVGLRPRLSGPEIRTLEMHRAIATKIESDPEGVRELAWHNLEVLRAADIAGNTEPYLDAWEDLINGPVARLVSVMTSTDQAARDLRQASPFAGVLSDGERLEVIMSTDGVRVAEMAGRSLDDVRQQISTAIHTGREMVENRL
jgi:transcriptional regulator with XRE-family HTH domain